MGIVLSTLPAAGQTGLNHHRQTTCCFIAIRTVLIQLLAAKPNKSIFTCTSCVSFASGMSHAHIKYYLVN